jgi:hypothetical protein
MPKTTFITRTRSNFDRKGSEFTSKGDGGRKSSLPRSAAVRRWFASPPVALASRLRGLQSLSSGGAGVAGK